MGTRARSKPWMHHLKPMLMPRPTQNAICLSLYSDFTYRGEGGGVSLYSDFTYSGGFPFILTSLIEGRGEGVPFILTSLTERGFPLF